MAFSKKQGGRHSTRGGESSHVRTTAVGRQCLKGSSRKRPLPFSSKESTRHGGMRKKKSKKSPTPSSSSSSWSSYSSSSSSSESAHRHRRSKRSKKSPTPSSSSSSSSSYTSCSSSSSSSYTSSSSSYETAHRRKTSKVEPQKYRAGLPRKANFDEIEIIEDFPTLANWKNERKKCLLQRHYDDCYIIDNPENIMPQQDCSIDNMQDLIIISDNGQIACRDYPHSRQYCTENAFAKVRTKDNAKHCQNENCVKITAMQWTKAPFGLKEGWRKDVKESSNDGGFVVGSLPSSNWASEVVQSPCVVGDDSWKISETI